MISVTYRIIPHDGGYAYRVGDVISETFRTRNEAREAAEDAARRQQISGGTEAIQYEDSQGHWHTELAHGDDRPLAQVDDPLETARARAAEAGRPHMTPRPEARAHRAEGRRR